MNDPATSTDLWLLNLRNPEEMRVLKNTPAAERQGSLSPDAHWIAYMSNESGRPEVYVEPVPNREGAGGFPAMAGKSHAGCETGGKLSIETEAR